MNVPETPSLRWPTAAAVQSPRHMLPVYTDGAASGNGKRNCEGGIGVFFHDGSPLNHSQGFRCTPSAPVTNNTMELKAAVHALETVALRGVPRGVEVRVYSDSLYTINCVTKWIRAWEKNGWRTKTGKPVANKELIQRLAQLSTQTAAVFRHVPSHTREPARTSPEWAHWYGNNQADALAVRGIAALRAG